MREALMLRKYRGPHFSDEEKKVADDANSLYQAIENFRLQTLL
jgi:hypothetical protein